VLGRSTVGIGKTAIAITVSAFLTLIAPGVASAARQAHNPHARSAGAASSQLRVNSQQVKANADSVSCPPLKFFGVRGSGETKSDWSGYGHTVWDVRATVLAQVPGAVAEQVNYPAIPVVYPSAKHLKAFLLYIATRYHTSEIAGIKNLTKAVGSFISNCPASYIVMAGYSQGAQVVGDTFLSHMTAAQRARVAGIAMLGDADFNGHSPIDIGNYSSGLNGIWAFDHSKRHVAAALRSKIASYCTQGDPICNFGLSNILVCKDHPNLCPHVHYIDLYWGKNTYVVDAGDFLVARYHKLVPPVTIGSKKNILLYGDNDPTDNDPSGMSNLASVLTAAGYTVTSMPGVTSLPSDLSAYGQIWHYGIEDSPSSADQQTLESFVKAGGSVFLTGEWGGTVQNLWDDQADEDIINALVPTGAVSMPDDEDPGIALPVNPTVIDQAAQIPNALTTWTGSDVGGMTGVPAANTFITDADGDAAGALWDNLGTGHGRLAIIMDINWPQNTFMDASTFPSVTQNLAYFLSH
jgi:Cutinase